MSAVQAYAVAAAERSDALRGVAIAEARMRALADEVRAELDVAQGPIGCHLLDGHTVIVWQEPDATLETLISNARRPLACNRCSAVIDVGAVDGATPQCPNCGSYEIRPNDDDDEKEGSND